MAEKRIGDMVVTERHLPAGETTFALVKSFVVSQGPGDLTFLGVDLPAGLRSGVLCTPDEAEAIAHGILRLVAIARGGGSA